MVQTILDVSRLESGAGELRPQAFAFDGLVEAATQYFEARAQEAGVQLTVDVDDALGDGRADLDLLGRTLENLIANAVERSSAGDEVIVRVEQNGGDALFCVADSGGSRFCFKLPAVSAASRESARESVAPLIGS